MEFEGISTSQIITVCAFLFLLIAAQLFIRKNGVSLRTRFKNQKRIKILEEMALSSNEKVRIISIDSSEFIFVSSKNRGPKILELDASKKGVPRGTSVTKVIAGKASSKASNTKANLAYMDPVKEDRSNTHELTNAINAAREMNPAVSYKK